MVSKSFKGFKGESEEASKVRGFEGFEGEDEGASKASKARTKGRASKLRRVRTKRASKASKMRTKGASKASKVRTKGLRPPFEAFEAFQRSFVLMSRRGASDLQREGASKPPLLFFSSLPALVRYECSVAHVEVETVNPNGLDAQIRLSSQQLHSRRAGDEQAEHAVPLRAGSKHTCTRTATFTTRTSPLRMFSCTREKGRTTHTPFFLHAGRRIPGGASAKQPAGRSTRARKVNRMLVQSTKYFRRHA